MSEECTLAELVELFIEECETEETGEGIAELVDHYTSEFKAAVKREEDVSEVCEKHKDLADSSVEREGCPWCIIEETHKECKDVRELLTEVDERLDNDGVIGATEASGQVFAD